MHLNPRLDLAHMQLLVTPLRLLLIPGALEARDGEVVERQRVQLLDQIRIRYGSDTDQIRIRQGSDKDQIRIR